MSRLPGVVPPDMFVIANSSVQGTCQTQEFAAFRVQGGTLVKSDTINISAYFIQVEHEIFPMIFLDKTKVYANIFSPDKFGFGKGAS